MSDPHATDAVSDPLAAAPSSRSATIRTAIFVLIVGGVLGTFLVLGQQGRPPDMPATPPHKLQISNDGALTGFVGEAAIDPIAAKQLDKKQVELRVNTTCKGCHGDPGDDPRVHACGQARCLPATHPPKSECIKCHRMPTATAPTSTK